jgi:hypothetical protein
MEKPCKFHPIKPSPKCRVCSSQSLPPAPCDPKPELKKPANKQGLMPTWGDKSSWNISSLMRKNVFSSSYFNNTLQPLTILSELVDEINTHVHSIEPWIQNTCYTPSSLFCILIKLFIIKLTEGQLRFMSEHINTYVRVAGFLYIRFLADPQEYWERFNHYTVDPSLIDEENRLSLTVGGFVEKILTEQDYFGLLLPRIPAGIQNLINKKCAQLKARRIRWEKNQQKTYEKDQNVLVYIEDVVKGVFKFRDGNKAHVQVDGKDLHVNIEDIDDTYSFCVEEIKGENRALAENKREYMKKSVGYKTALIFSIPKKRSRSPSPVEKEVDLGKKQPKLELCSLGESDAKKNIEKPSTEYFKIG